MHLTTASVDAVGRSAHGTNRLFFLFSLDAKRLYVANSLYSSWNNQFYPRIAEEGSYLLQIDCDALLSGSSYMPYRFCRPWVHRVYSKPRGQRFCAPSCLILKSWMMAYLWSGPEMATGGLSQSWSGVTRPSYTGPATVSSAIERTPRMLVRRLLSGLIESWTLFKGAARSGPGFCAWR